MFWVNPKMFTVFVKNAAATPELQQYTQVVSTSIGRDWFTVITSLNRTCYMTYTGHPGVCASVGRPQLLQLFCGRRQDSRQRSITSADTWVNVTERDKHRQTITHGGYVRRLLTVPFTMQLMTPRPTPVHVSLNNTEQLGSRGRDLPVAHWLVCACLDTDPLLFVWE